jgi:hypothetical protein
MEVLLFVSSISSSAFSTYAAQSQQTQVQQAFKQLTQDLKSGNLSAAQADFVTLQQAVPQSSTESSSASSNPISQDFMQLGQDLKSGNLSAGQQDFAKIQQDSQTQSTQGHPHHHHRSRGGSSSQEGTTSPPPGHWDPLPLSGNLSPRYSKPMRRCCRDSNHSASTMVQSRCLAP